MTIREVEKLAIELKNKHSELFGWRISFNRRKRSFGLCNYLKMEISLSSVLIPFMTDNAIKDTIVHEIAHALTRGHGHNNVWRRKCIELGGTGECVGDYNKFKDGEKSQIELREKSSKYTLVCPSCGNKSYINRKPKNDISCGLHGDRYYNPLHKLTVIQNY